MSDMSDMSDQGSVRALVACAGSVRPRPKPFSTSVTALAPTARAGLARRPARSTPFGRCRLVSARGVLELVVMANVLPPTPCDLTFDLKGAT